MPQNPALDFVSNGSSSLLVWKTEENEFCARPAGGGVAGEEMMG